MSFSSTNTERIYDERELNGTNVKELKAIAGQFDIPHRYKMRKNELVNSILSYQADINSQMMRNNNNYRGSGNSINMQYNGRRGF